MPTVNNVEHLRKWFRQCPALSKANHFRVDYLAEEATENIANYGFYQDVIDWIINQNSSRNLPCVNEGRVLSVVPTLTQYVSAPGASSAKYQIQIKLTYRRR